jgi:hypothetical protein|tara:strand:+ start:993 stop:1922 length:930 start_codon:yes stop_codon:yes gene_type:complete
MDNFNLQSFVKKSKNEFYANLYEGQKEYSMEEKMHDNVEEGINGDRIVGLLNVELKNNFLAAGHAVITNFLEGEGDDEYEVGEVVSALANELERHYDAPTYGEEELEEGEIAGKWNKLSNDQKLDLLLQAYKDPDEAEEYVDYTWNELPDVATQNMRLKEGEIADEMEDEFYDGEHEEKKHLTNEVSMDASALETAMALISGVLGLPAVAVLSQKAQDAFKAHNEKNANKGKEALKEEEGDGEIEVPAEVDMDMDMEAPESEAEDSKEIFSKLVDAYESAKALGDEKLTRQLANTITYFNKSVIFGDTK